MCSLWTGDEAGGAGAGTGTAWKTGEATGVGAADFGWNPALLEESPAFGRAGAKGTKGSLMLVSCSRN